MLSLSHRTFLSTNRPPQPLACVCLALRRTISFLSVFLESLFSKSPGERCVGQAVAVDRSWCGTRSRERSRMKSVVVVGAQWGDEGKGKVVDYLAGSFDYIVRVAGGHNAGHTVIIGKDKHVLQLIPCGILRPKQHAVIGMGVVVDPVALVKEIEMLAKFGIDVTGRLHISNRAHLIFPYHRELDKAAEG